MKIIALLSLVFIMLVSLLPALSCAPQEEPPEIASYSLNQVIGIATERSPECRLQVPGVESKG